MTLRAGVIGLGVGEEHAVAYAAHPGCELVAICDSSEERLAAVGKDHSGVHSTTRPDEILEDPEIDLVSVASWDDAHHDQVTAALRSGKHVFVEKPLCQTEEQAREIFGVLRERPELRLSSNLPLREEPRFREVRELVRSGDLGEIYYVEGDYDYGRLWKLTEGWRGDLERYSVFLGGGVHIVDLILWLTGERAVRVSAAGNRIATEGSKFRHPDLVAALIEFEGGPVAKVTANFACVHPHFHGLEVFGTEGTFINGLEQGELWRAGEEGPERSTIDTPYPAAGKGALIPSFVESIAGKGSPLVSAEDVFAAMAVCFAAERSLESGQPSEVRDFL